MPVSKRLINPVRNLRGSRCMRWKTKKKLLRSSIKKPRKKILDFFSSKISNGVKLLDKNQVKYEIIKHRTVYTAYDKAQTLRIPEKIVGKILVVNLGNRGVALRRPCGAGKKFAFVLIPANKNLDKIKFQKISGAKKIAFAKEAWMKKNLKGIKVGAVPPFGNLWGVSTFVDRALLKQPKIIVNSGDHNFSIKLKPAALKKIIPDLVVGNFTQTKPRI